MIGCVGFETELGPCAIAWSEDDDTATVVGFALPEATLEQTVAALQRRHKADPTAPPPVDVAGVIVRVQRLLGGAAENLRDVPVDFGAIAPFAQGVYEWIRTIGPGQVRTYGQVAAAVQAPGGAQAVGQVMGRNPIPVIVPCHRVVAAGARLGGFSAPGHAETKRRLLAIEGAPLPGAQPTLFR
jgi:methylated-DNA-[protein]-cysteine S-methyltransferase